MKRRGFLKILGGAAVAVAAAPLVTPATAPLFVPSDRLDMGVPRRILTATELPARTTTLSWKNVFIDTEEIAVSVPIPMLLVHDEFRPPGWQQFGRQKVPAGTTLLVDRTTAERWVENGVGTPGPAAPRDLQAAAAQRMAARTPPSGEATFWASASSEWAPVRRDATRPPVAVLSTREKDRRDRRWSDMIERASARLERAARTPEMAWWDDADGQA